MGKFAAAMILWIASGAGVALAQPRGDGDPASVTCMKGVKKTGSFFVSPPVCKTNAEWAQLYKQRMDPANIGNPTACIGPEGPVDKGGVQTCR
jgi:hypothetical protein